MDSKIESKAYELYNLIMIDPTISTGMKSTIQKPYTWLSNASMNYKTWLSKINNWEKIMAYHRYMCHVAKLSGMLDREKKIKSRKSV